MGEGAGLWDMIDVNTLQEIQSRFAEATGLAAIIADSHGRALTQASHFCELCRNIRATALGRQRCFDSDADAGREAARTRKPHIHYCHAGLLDVAAPIVVNDEYAGSVLCGQVLLDRPDAAKRRAIAAQLGDLGVSPEVVDKGLDNITVMPAPRLKAAADLLYILANYIVNLVVSLQTQRRLSEESRARMELEKNLKEMELRVLQSQVNPHFLFNALNTVARMALFEDAVHTQELVFRMTRILRFSLSRIDQLVPLREELTHVEDYLHIQKARFGERIRSRFEISPQVMDVPIPILTVQPIVENAVVRGLEPLVEGGEVAIRAWVDGDDAVVEVLDNGTGLDPARGNFLLSQAAAPSSGGHTTGLGIPNVHQRLQHYFGRHYGLAFLPVARGTLVRIRVPLGAAVGGMAIAKVADS